MKIINSQTIDAQISTLKASVCVSSVEFACHECGATIRDDYPTNNGEVVSCEIARCRHCSQVHMIVYADGNVFDVHTLADTDEMPLASTWRRAHPWEIAGAQWCVVCNTYKSVWRGCRVCDPQPPDLDVDEIPF